MDYIQIYVDFLKKHTDIKKPLKVVCDCSNGPIGMILRALMPQLNLAEYTLINDKPDPNFSAHGPNPLLPGATDQLIAKVKEKKADIGVIFDADGDRAFFVDNNGVPLPSFIIASLLFKHRQPPFVVDELVYKALQHIRLFPGRILQPAHIGVFFIKQRMKEVGATTGAEFSGHFYFNEFFGADSGIFAMLSVFSLISTMSESLTDYIAHLPQHIVRNVDLKIAGKDWDQLQKKIIDVYVNKGAIIERREGITVQLDDSWINVRPSNTEPILRLYAGTSSEQNSLSIIEEMKNLVA